MRLVRDPEAEQWLLRIEAGAGDFDWGAGNATKSRKHGVEPHDVEALVRGDLYLAGRITEPTHEELRWLALGEDARGRRLALIFTRRGERLRPISCRPMHRKEKALYEKAARKENQAPSR